MIVVLQTHTPPHTHTEHGWASSMVTQHDISVGIWMVLVVCGRQRVYYHSTVWTLGCSLLCLFWFLTSSRFIGHLNTSVCVSFTGTVGKSVI